MNEHIAYNTSADVAEAKADYLSYIRRVGRSKMRYADNTPIYDIRNRVQLAQEGELLSRLADYLEKEFESAEGDDTRKVNQWSWWHGQKASMASSRLIVVMYLVPELLKKLQRYMSDDWDNMHFFPAWLHVVDELFPPERHFEDALEDMLEAITDKTYGRDGEVEPQTHIVDDDGRTLGRLSIVLRRHDIETQKWVPYLLDDTKCVALTRIREHIKATKYKFTHDDRCPPGNYMLTVNSAEYPEVDYAMPHVYARNPD